MCRQKLDKQQDDTDLDLLQKALHQLLEQVSKRDQKIAWINAENTAALRMLVEREQAMLAEKAETEFMLRHTQAQLAEREAQFNEIVNSRTWKAALLLQRIRVFLVPPKSRRV